MDRFIVVRYIVDTGTETFKIQYGQIYRFTEPRETHNNAHLKSNMDRFIVGTVLMMSM